MLARQLSLTDGLATPRYRRPAGAAAAQAPAPPLSRAASLAAAVTITATAVGPKDARRCALWHRILTMQSRQLPAAASVRACLLLVCLQGHPRTMVVPPTAAPACPLALASAGLHSAPAASFH